ncbi:hypothetical protein [Tautonia plasticadhaerens]|uniref:Ankyrin repeats (3 copies) n=1 Tax=Tautonia plasticadhaerens TaxID=2527974 RepID=A0A518H1A9_9BACT|nr:hypothetical protein [Tautonia plasticadhaerens]QDV34624.1 hypothetical protein ElP_25150 [Tautonia plasticadhaerens]
MDDTPLHEVEIVEDVERFLDADWPVDAPGCMGATPLFDAAERGLTEVARALALGVRTSTHGVPTA